MKNQSTGFLFAAALLAAGCAWGQMASSGMSGTYTQFEAATLKKSPHHAWARSIAFLDEIAPDSAGKPQRLDRRLYYPVDLKSAGTVWIREDRIDQFQALPPDTPFTFGGTVDQFNRRYYIILDAAYQVETLPTQEERWTDVLANPPRPPAPDFLPDETAADLPTPPPIPADTATEQQDTPSWSEVMTDIVGITDDSTTPEPPALEAIASENAEVEPPAVPDLPDDEPASADSNPLVEDMVADLDDFFSDEAGTDLPAETAEQEPVADDFDFPPALPIEVEDVPPAVADVDDFDAALVPGAPDEPAEDALFAGTEPPVVEEELEPAPEPDIPAPSDSFEDSDILEAATDTEPDPISEPVPVEDAASDSYHVEPMGDSAPIAIVPLVSLQPTKAEMEVQEAQRREAERQAKIEAKRQREAEAKRQKAEAAARKKAEAEARAELERTRREAEAARKAEEKRLREEEAVALAAMEAREAQERETAARIAAREATQKERDALAERIEAEKAAIAERSRMVQEVTVAEQAAREEAERLAREETERQEALLAEKAQMEAELAALAEQEREMNDRLTAEQAAREKAERLVREENERQEALLAEKARLEAELAAQAERERAAADKLAAEQAAREEAERAAATIDVPAAEKPEQPVKLSRRERREIERAERAARAKAEAEAKALAEATEQAAEQAAETEPAAPQTSDDLPEWMQPVFF